MKTIPFDPTDFLRTEEAIAAFLEDAQSDTPEAQADALDVVSEARRRYGLVAAQDQATARSDGEQRLAKKVA